MSNTISMNNKVNMLDDEQKIKETSKEIIIYSGKINLREYIIPIILVLTLRLSPIGIYYIFYYKLKKIELTNKKFTYSYGILNTKQLTIKLEKIESIQIKKDLVDMLFGSGVITVNGTGGNNARVPGIHKPEQLKKAIEGQINK